METVRTDGTRWARVGAIAGVLLFLWVLFQPAHPPDFSDFEVYYVAAGKALEHRTVYDVPGHYQFKYAPWTALLFGALYGKMPFLWASWIHYIGMAILTLLGIRWVSRKAGFTDLPPLRAIGWALLVFAVSIRDEWKLGQVNVDTLALLLPAFLAAGDPSRSRWGALAFAHAILFKLYALIAIPWFVFRREWKLLQWTGVFLAVFLLIAPSVFYGPGFAASELVNWFRTLADSTGVLLLSSYNISVQGFASRWAGEGIGAFSWIATCVGFLWMTWSARAEDGFWGFAWVLCGIPLLNPLAWPYWTFFAVPAFFLLWARRKEFGHWPFRASGILALTLFFQNLPSVRSNLVGPVLLIFAVTFYLTTIRVSSHRLHEPRA